MAGARLDLELPACHSCLSALHLRPFPARRLVRTEMGRRGRSRPRAGGFRLHLEASNATSRLHDFSSVHEPYSGIDSDRHSDIGSPRTVTLAPRLRVSASESTTARLLRSASKIGLGSHLGGTELAMDRRLWPVAGRDSTPRIRAAGLLADPALYQRAIACCGCAGSWLFADRRR